MSKPQGEAKVVAKKSLVGRKMTLGELQSMVSAGSFASSEEKDDSSVSSYSSTSSRSNGGWIKAGSRSKARHNKKTSDKNKNKKKLLLCKNFVGKAWGVCEPCSKPKHRCGFAHGIEDQTPPHASQFQIRN